MKLYLFGSSAKDETQKFKDYNFLIIPLEPLKFNDSLKNEIK